LADNLLIQKRCPVMGKFKKSLFRSIFVLIVFLALLGLFLKRLRQPLGESLPSSGHQPKAGVVTAVYDGDTIKVKFKHSLEKRVRLIGIDAPELDDERERVQFLAYLAKRFSFFHLYKKEVSLSYDWQLEDEYGRLLAYIWVDNRLFNDFILREGFASAFLKFPFRKDYQKRFKDSEKFARKNGKGFWSQENFPRIRPLEARDYLGKLVSVVFKCTGLEKKRQFLFLNSSWKGFSALIPQERLSLFSGWENYSNRNLEATGFLEEYKGQLQILIGVPCQLEILDNKKTGPAED